METQSIEIYNWYFFYFRKSPFTYLWTVSFVALVVHCSWFVTNSGRLLWFYVKSRLKISFINTRIRLLGLKFLRHFSTISIYVLFYDLRTNTYFMISTITSSHHKSFVSHYHMYYCHRILTCPSIFLISLDVKKSKTFISFPQ